VSARRRGWALALLVAAAGACGRHSHGQFDAAHALAAAARLAPVSAAERRECLRRARIFENVHVATRDLTKGPPDAHGFAFLAPVSCDFIEPRAARVPTGGTTPKFFCTLRHPQGHDDVKVKYGRDNREIYGEVLASRLLWALGLAVDRDYPVRVRCHGCPREPWIAYRDFPGRDLSPRETRELDDAVIQRLYPGVPIEECLRVDHGRCAQARDDQGWVFTDLDLVDEAAGGASRAEVDALRLLAAFIAHGDDKPENQRLVCPFDAIDGAGHCRAPRLLIADLGSTFGRGASRVLGLIDTDARPSWAAWSTLPVWEDAAACRAHLKARLAPAHPTISEAGRRFLAERLAALTDTQIRGLFTVARVERMGELRLGADGPARPVTVEDWVDAFKRRRAEVVEHRCPQ
jgi:hypothetical protein